MIFYSKPLFGKISPSPSLVRFTRNVVHGSIFETTYNVLDINILMLCI